MYRLRSHHAKPRSHQTPWFYQLDQHRARGSTKVRFLLSKREGAAGRTERGTSQHLVRGGT